MDNESLEKRLKITIEQNRQLQEELEEMNRGLIALTMELEEKNEEMKAMTQQLWTAARLATMGELSASIAHELNNPLATVSLRIELILEQISQDDPIKKSLEIILQEVTRMGYLVKNLLDFSRRNQRQISTLDICEEIEKTLELILYHLRKQGIKVITEFQDKIFVQGDRQQFRQLFLNLFTNASDAMPQGGELRVKGYEELEKVVIDIADTGTGILPDDLEKVMEPFFTTKPEGKGTGLGLPICRRIVQDHQGSFSIKSGEKGTTVTISFPIIKERNARYNWD